MKKREPHRHVCTEANPWREGLGYPVLHPDAREVGEQIDGWPSGDLQRMECPHCGVSWLKELPQ